ncbi:MAG: ribonuclease H-like domain-containing protein, partial [Chloroflexota bacterium]
MLHLARRLWKNRLPSRTLVYLEEHILGEKRTEDDVPGWMIPAMYLDYIRSGDGRELQGVFYHNAMDILSMAALTNQAAHMLADPLNGNVEHGEDLASLGMLFEDMGQIDKASQTMKQALDLELPTELYQRTLMRLARLHKRKENHDDAISLWWQAAADRQIYAHEELAKFYEHREHNFNEAIQWCNSAIAILKSSDVPRHEQVFWEPEFEHRLARLIGKLARKSSD